MTRLKPTAMTTRTRARTRFRVPKSVAKYHPKSASQTSSMKNITPGVMAESALLEHVGHRALFHLNLYVVGHFHNHGGVLDVRNQPVDAGSRDDLVPRFPRRHQVCRLFLPSHLRANHHVIHDDDEEKERQHPEKAAARRGG